MNNFQVAKRTFPDPRPWLAFSMMPGGSEIPFRDFRTWREAYDYADGYARSRS